MYFKKLLKISLLFILVYACEEIPNGTIESETIDYIIEDISAPDLVVFSPGNPELLTSIKISNAETVRNVWVDLNTGDGLESISSSNVMFSNENGSTKIYSGSVTLNENLLSGFYELAYYVEDNARTDGENIRKVGIKIFQLESEAINFPPVISNLIMPNEIARGVEFTFSINVSDPNGLIDIKQVYFTLLRPDGTIVYADESKGIKEFRLFDNGDGDRGDQTAGDGVYSLKNSFSSTSQTGNWIFTFNAIDKSDSLSNTITHILNVK